MNTDDLAFEGVEAVSYQTLLRAYNERVTLKEKDESAAVKKEVKDSRFVPIKLKPEEAKKVQACQEVMLNFALVQYQKSKGTDKEEMMRIMYNDAVIDYKNFMAQHKDELS